MTLNSFDRAWNIVKNNDGSTPQPIGILDGKRVVMYRGKPYYQSTGTSRIAQKDGSTAFKRKGGWYGFGGLDTEGRYGMGKDWWIKGRKSMAGSPNFPQHAVLHHDPVADETGQLFYEPNLFGGMVSQWEKENPHLMAGRWANVRDSQQMNELLEEKGWRVFDSV